MSESSRPRGIDPRGPRFAAAITTALLAIAVVLSLTGIATQRWSADAAAFGWFAYAPLADAVFSPGTDLAFVAGSSAFVLPLAPLAARVLDPGFVLVLVLALLFLWSVVSPRTAPWGVLYRRVVQPRLGPPTELEDPRPPRFAQGVGLFVTAVGLLLHLIGVPWALPVATAMAFVAAFLNAAFGVCLGCQLYLVLQRAGVIGRSRPAV